VTTIRCADPGGSCARADRAPAIAEHALAQFGAPIRRVVFAMPRARAHARARCRRVAPGDAANRVVS
jgi:hypothetical protein